MTVGRAARAASDGCRAGAPCSVEERRARVRSALQVEESRRSALGVIAPAGGSGARREQAAVAATAGVDLAGHRGGWPGGARRRGEEAHATRVARRRAALCGRAVAYRRRCCRRDGSAVDHPAVEVQPRVSTTSTRG
ncbi:hypothetical protein WMF38_05355 [Sorangium sp. So ce118]